jgi:hypothetical protein
METLLNNLYTAQQIINEAYGRFNTEQAVRSQATRTRDAGLKKLKDSRLLILPITIAVFIVMFISIGTFVEIAHLEKNLSLRNVLVPIILFGSPVGGAAIYFLLVRPIIKKKEKKLQTACENELQRADALHGEGISILRQNGEALAFIPESYRYPLAVSWFVKFAQEGRAPTMQDALDRYDEQQHRWRMENAQRNMLQLQQQQMNQLNAIRSDINWNTAITSIGVAANFISRF